MSKILIVDDEVQIRTLLARMMELEGYEVCQAGDCRAALKQLELQSPDVALCDVFLPDGNGVDLVLAIKKAAPNVEVILLTAHGNIPDGVQAIKNGAFDYITKGDDNNKIIPLISRAVEKAAMNARLEKLEKKVGQAYSFDSILGESKSLKDAVLLAQKVSVTDVPVLLTGETQMLLKCIDQFAQTRAVCPGLLAVAPGGLMQEIADYSLMYPQLLLPLLPQSSVRCQYYQIYPCRQFHMQYQELLHVLPPLPLPLQLFHLQKCCHYLLYYYPDYFLYYS